MVALKLFWALAAGVLFPLATAAADCGGDVACTVEDGSYRIEMPDAQKAKGVLVFFHGYKSSSTLQMQHRALVEVAKSHGLAFAAVDGLNGTWSHPNAPGNFRDEKRFIGHVFDDLQSRFGFTAENTLIGGFSQGASMAWYTLCQQGDRVAGSVTFSGVFWDDLPKPTDCTPKIPPMVHFHGTADRTFPLAGRAIGDGYHQGDTFKSFAVVRERAMCDTKNMQKQEIAGLSCDVAPGCARGESALCIHDGGHQVQPEQLDAGLTALGY